MARGERAGGKQSRRMGLGFDNRLPQAFGGDEGALDFPEEIEGAIASELD
jgi:hypothetical protein